MSPQPTSSTSGLDQFETALLSELRGAVSARTAPRRQRTRVLSIAGVAATAATAFGISLAVGGSAPAFAVETGSGGDISVTVNRLEDASGLEQALAAKGVAADVRYQGATTDSDPAGRIQPNDLPAGSHRYTDAECEQLVGQGISVDDEGTLHVLIPASAAQTGDRLTLLVAGSPTTDADLLLAVGNNASGCLSQSANGGDAWVRWTN